MQALIDAIERIPVATITHALVALILGVDLIVQGSLSSDALTYAGIVEGGNVGVAGARAHVKAAKVKQPKHTSAHTGTVNVTLPPPPAADYAPDEPGDPDSLPHISTADPSRVPPDQGDAGTEAVT